ncbi:MAG: alpha-xylosidase [Hyphomicrobiales bacterium]
MSALPQSTQAQEVTEFDILNPDWSACRQTEILGEAKTIAPGQIQFETTDGPFYVTAIENGVRLNLGPHDRPDYGILHGDPAPLPVDVKIGDGETTLGWGYFTLVVRHQPMAIDFRRWDRAVLETAKDAHFVREFRLPPFAKVDKGWLVSLDLPSQDPVYGLGEKWGLLDKRGQLVHSFTHDALGVNSERSYKNCPFSWSPAGWGVFVNTPAPVLHAVGFAQWSHRSYGLLVEDEAVDLFLMAGENPEQILERYTRLTGRPAMPPLWSLGAILSKAYYQTPAEFLEAAQTVRTYGMPCDTITFDGRAWQDTDTRFHFDFDPKRFDDPKVIIDQVKEMGFHVCCWEYPLVSVNSPIYEELSDKGYFLKDRRTHLPYRYEWDMEPFGAVLTPLPDSSLLDFTNPDAYNWWRDEHKALFGLGVDMIKSDFGEQVEPDCVAFNGDTGDRLHNVYPLLYNRCVYEAAEMYAENGACLLARAGWASSQRYPAQWGGDPQADWEGLAASLRGGLSWANSGAACYATDIGGFYGDTRDSELFVRWTQAAVFSSHMRFHGIGDRAPWSYGERAANAVMAALKLRYRLLPYLWETLKIACASGMPVQRSMAVAFPEDPASWSFDLQFMFGPDVLVSPIVRTHGKGQTYLPAGRWKHLVTQDTLEGGRVINHNLDLEQMAVYVREGAIIPFGPTVQHTGQLGDVPLIEEKRRY